MSRFNKMDNQSGGRPRKKKVKPIDNPDYFAGWEWLFGNGKQNAVRTREGHQITKKRKNTIYGVLFYCKKCEKTWEQDKVLMRTNGEGIEHYSDFPTRGLPRKKCPHCKGGRNGGNLQNTKTRPKD